MGDTRCIVVLCMSDDDGDAYKFPAVPMCLVENMRSIASSRQLCMSDLEKLLELDYTKYSMKCDHCIVEENPIPADDMYVINA